MVIFAYTTQVYRGHVIFINDYEFLKIILFTHLVIDCRLSQAAPYYFNIISDCKAKYISAILVLNDYILHKENICTSFACMLPFKEIKFQVEIKHCYSQFVIHKYP